MNDTPSTLEREVERLRRELAAAQGERDAVARTLEREVERLRRELAAAQGKRDAANQHCKILNDSNDAKTRLIEAQMKDLAAARAEVERHQPIMNTTERDQLRADCENETKWAAHYLAESIAVKGERDQLRAELATERAENEEQARLLGMSAERECDLRGRLERLRVATSCHVPEEIE